MIIIQITGGLGNQMFQYAIGKAISIHHNQVLKLDIMSYNKFQRHNGYRLDAMNIDNKIATNNEIKLFKFLSKFSFITKKKRFKEKERTIYDKTVFQYPHIYLNGYWHNEQYFVKIKAILEKEFEPRGKISQNAQDYLNLIQNTNSISIHIRRGDYLNHPNLGVLDLNYYQKAINEISIIQDNPIFYFFSDDIEWCKENFSFVNEKIYIQNTHSEIEDLFLMKNCKHNIIANSTFSWWGAWLNKNTNKIVIAPKQWMAHNPKNYTWVPHAWKQI